MHTIEDRDGLRVFVVGDVNRRFHPKTGLELPAKKIDDRLVHASDIAKFYAIPLQTIGLGDNRVPGVWELVHSNAIGLRVPYNTEAKERTDRTVRIWRKKFDAAGTPIASEQEMVSEYFDQDLDDGMYVRLDDLLLYAEANGWTKGGGRPKPQVAVASPTADIAGIVAAVLTALGQKPAEPAKREMSAEDRAAIGQRLAAARAAKKAAQGE